jgi:drug/metabolite transporter (DMT)-like permease
VIIALKFCPICFRTAAQKQMGQNLSAMITSWVRFAFGLPIAVIYFVILWIYYDSPNININPEFYRYASLSAIAQIGATVAAVKVLTLRNFAVGTTWIKTEAIMTAIIGAIAFGAVLSWNIWAAIGISVIGMFVLAVRKAKLSWWSVFTQKSTVYGLAAGTGFALCSLWLREAVISIDAPYLLQASITMVFMLSLQTVVAGMWVKQQNHQFSELSGHFNAAIFIGATSAFGSIGWFTAMTMESAALVKALGQIEFIITMMITWFYFKEKITKLEYIGILLVVSALALLFVNRF